MVIGIGTDLVEINRIQRLINEQGDRFIKRVFTPSEQKRAEASAFPASSYAKRFAAKEAFVKAIQTDEDGIAWTDIEVVNASSGAPGFILKGKALEALTSLNSKADVFLSLSDTETLAQAMVVIAVRA